jgi:hypothetical protein
MRNLLLILAIASAPLGAILAKDGGVPYPDGYRAWHHVKSMVILPGHPLEDPFAGVHHIYANDKALAGLQRNRYEDGAVLVFDLLESVRSEHAVEEGERKLVGVMAYDAQRYADTGGWGFEGFAGNSRTERLVDDGGQACFACHASQEDRQYVFTRPRD